MVNILMKNKMREFKFTYLFNCLIIFCISLGYTLMPAFAYEDCLVTTNGKMTEIRIENHDIIDVYPLITVMNDKNTLIVHPLKTGETRFSVLKNNKDIALFHVKITPDETKIDDVKGYEILTLDGPPEIYEYELDFPPVIQEVK